MASKSNVMIAKRSFSCIIDGRQYTVRKGVDRVAADHELVKEHPDFFETADFTVTFPLTEAATANPGEKRGRGNGGESGDGADEE